MKITVGKGVDLSKERELLKAEVDRLAGVERRKFVTTDPGQSYVYAEKLREAKAFLETDYNDTTDFHFLRQESIARNITPKGLAQSIILRNEVTNRRLATIEAERFKVKQAIDEAEDKLSSIRAVLDACIFKNGGMFHGEQE